MMLKKNPSNGRNLTSQLSEPNLLQCPKFTVDLS